MTPNWTYTEKIIGSILIILGGFILYSTFMILSLNLAIVSKYLGQSMCSILTPKFIWNYHSFLIIFLLLIFSGVTLIRNKKLGWLLAIALLFYFTILISLILLNTDKTDWSFDRTAEFYISRVFMALVSISMCLLLLLKPFRNKYNPTTSNWLFIILTIGFLFTDYRDYFLK